MVKNTKKAKWEGLRLQGPDVLGDQNKKIQSYRHTGNVFVVLFAAETEKQGGNELPPRKTRATNGETR